MSERGYLLLGLLAPLIVVTILLLGVPRFADVYRGFDMPLPWQTTLLLRGHVAIALLPFACLSAWFLWPKREERGRATLVAGLPLSLAVFLFAVWAAYSPIARLGAWG